jgi:fructose-1,6-bisphosphatase/inositol monophosphatase family enzyme
LSGLDERLAVTAVLAEQASEIVFPWFGASPDVTNKASEDAIEPVTAANHVGEEFLRHELTRRFPEDRLLGQETGESGGFIVAAGNAEPHKHAPQTIAHRA